MSKKITTIVLIILGLLSIFAFFILKGPGSETVSAASNGAKGLIAVNDNGVPMEFISAKRNGETVQTILCYDLPAKGDWQLGEGSEDTILTVGEKSFLAEVYGLVDTKNKKNEQGKRRCAYLLFTIPADQDIHQATLTITKLATSMPEIPDCETAQKKLDSKKKDIVIQCEQKEGVFDYTIEKKPVHMTEDEAKKVAYEEGLIDTLMGPWVFSIDIE